MKRIVYWIAIGAAAMGTGALAHDTDTPHETRGDCERAMAEINTIDREVLSEKFPQLFDSRGAAMKYLTHNFHCEYDEDLDAWLIVRS